MERGLMVTSYYNTPDVIAISLKIYFLLKVIHMMFSVLKVC